MKIELKNIEFTKGKTMYENKCSGSLFIDETHAGEFSYQGAMMETTYTAIDQQGKDLIKEAEIYCKSLPPHEYTSEGERRSIAMDLEIYIDNLLITFMKEDLTKQFRNQVAALAKTGIVVGIPDQSAGVLNLEQSIDDLLKFDYGVELIVGALEKFIKSELKDGKVILNTNIPEVVYKLAGLQENQYLKQNIEEQKPIQKITKKRGPKL